MKKVQKGGKIGAAGICNLGGKDEIKSHKAKGASAGGALFH
jgi:hypothetical protein